MRIASLPAPRRVLPAAPVVASIGWRLGPGDDDDDDDDDDETPIGDPPDDDDGGDWDDDDDEDDDEELLRAGDIAAQYRQRACLAAQ